MSANGVAALDLRAATLCNEAFRRVLDTSLSLQTAAMALLPGENTGVELHRDVEQRFYVHQGTACFRFGENAGRAPPDDVGVTRIDVGVGGYLRVPRGTHHYVECAANARETLKLETCYSEVMHAPGTVHERMADAAREKEFRHSVASAAGGT